MNEIKIKGKRKSYYIAEWKDIQHIVKRHLREHKQFYAQLADL